MFSSGMCPAASTRSALNASRSFPRDNTSFSGSGVDGFVRRVHAREGHTQPSVIGCVPIVPEAELALLDDSAAQVDHSTNFVRGIGKAGDLRHHDYLANVLRCHGVQTSFELKAIYVWTTTQQSPDELNDGCDAAAAMSRNESGRAGPSMAIAGGT